MPSCRRQETPKEIDPVGKTAGGVLTTCRTIRRYNRLETEKSYVGIKARSSGSLGLLGLFKISQFASHNTGSAGLDLQHCETEVSFRINHTNRHK